jgi:hypothetical protein
MSIVSLLKHYGFMANIVMSWVTAVGNQQEIETLHNIMQEMHPTKHPAEFEGLMVRLGGDPAEVNGGHFEGLERVSPTQLEWQDYGRWRTNVEVYNRIKETYPSIKIWWRCDDLCTTNCPDMGGYVIHNEEDGETEDVPTIMDVVAYFQRYGYPVSNGEDIEPYQDGYELPLWYEAIDVVSEDEY